MSAAAPQPDKARLRFLRALAAGAARPRAAAACIRGCIDADLIEAIADGGFALSAAGRAYLTRHQQGGPARDGVDPFRAQHLHLAQRSVATEDGAAQVLIDDGESPLAWLARRKGRDGRALLDSVQFLAGERLRADFTRGHLTPRVTSSWTSPIGGGKGGGAGEMTDLIVAARQRLRLALEAVGPEFAGLLLDVCCFLRGLDDLERERGWPSRSAKVVLQLALDRLARHYGLAQASRGPDRQRIRTWLAADASFTADVSD